jgi:hypothetical protein
MLCLHFNNQHKFIDMIIDTALISTSHFLRRASTRVRGGTIAAGAIKRSGSSATESDADSVRYDTCFNISNESGPEISENALPNEYLLDSNRIDQIVRVHPLF